jgi:hypothetical protein
MVVVLHGFFFDAVFTTWRRGFATVMLVPNLRQGITRDEQ